MPAPNVSIPPNNAIGLLAMQFASGWAYGSGAMISPTQVATCAHNLVDQSTQATATQVLFYPAWNAAWPASPPPANGMAAAAAFYAAQYTTGQDAWDIGYVCLAAPPSNIPPAFFVPTVTDDEIEGQFIIVSGYPSAQGGMQWFEQDTVNVIYAPENLMSYTADTWAGNSGGPVWWYDAVTDVVYLRGIHTSQDTPDIRQGRLMTKQVVDWFKKAAKQPIPSAFAVAGL